MPFRIEISGIDKCKENFHKLATVIPDTVAMKGMIASEPILKGKAQSYAAGKPIDEYQSEAFEKEGTTYLGTESLHRRSGDLALRGIGSAIGEENGNVGVAVGTSILYGRIHEFGGIIKPVRAPALVFKIGDRLIRTQKVTMPSRPFLLPALLACKTMIEKIFTAEFWKEVKDGTK